MPSSLSIFLDFNLPNSTTWFYFSFLLAVAMFFKFSRFLSVRNLDVVLIFLLVPGFLILQASRPRPTPIEKSPAVQVASLIGHGATATSAAELSGHVAHFSHECGSAIERHQWLWYGYLWLLAGSVLFFCRCIFDLILEQRPALGPNVQIEGMVWLAGALLICLLAVAYKQVERHHLPPLLNGLAEPGTQPAPSQDQTVFAVAYLWHDLAPWAVAVLSFACQLTVVILLVVISWQHFQDVTNGMAAAAFYLLLPYTGLYVGQLQHVLPMALFLGVIVAYRQPTVSGAILGIATAATYFPAFVLPIWLSFYRERGMGRFLGAFLLALAAGFAVIGVTLWANDVLERSIQSALDSAAWQPWRNPEGTAEGFWAGIHWAYRIPVFVLFMSFVAATMFWPAPKNLAHIIALCAAVFISLQWWSAEQGGVYVLWYVPLLLLLIFRPNLQDRVPPEIDPETDWLTGAISWCGQTLRRLARLPEPAEKTPVGSNRRAGSHGSGE